MRSQYSAVALSVCPCLCVQTCVVCWWTSRPSSSSGRGVFSVQRCGPLSVSHSLCVSMSLCTDMCSVLVDIKAFLQQWARCVLSTALWPSLCLSLSVCPCLCVQTCVVCWWTSRPSSSSGRGVFSVQRCGPLSVSHSLCVSMSLCTDMCSVLVDIKAFLQQWARCVLSTALWLSVCLSLSLCPCLCVQTCVVCWSTSRPSSSSGRGVFSVQRCGPLSVSHSLCVHVSVYRHV